jgi:hypothetical protein
MTKTTENKGLRHYFIVGNRYEGCARNHKTRATAEACLDRLARKSPSARRRYSVYKIDARTGKAVTL